jgi:hypothetical protein
MVLMYEYICILSPPNIMGLPRHDDIIRVIFISCPYSYMPIGFGWNKRYSILFYSILLSTTWLFHSIFFSKSYLSIQNCNLLTFQLYKINSLLKYPLLLFSHWLIFLYNLRLNTDPEHFQKIENYFCTTRTNHINSCIIQPKIIAAKKTLLLLNFTQQLIGIVNSKFNQLS